MEFLYIVPIIAFWLLILFVGLTLTVKLCADFYQWLCFILDDYERLEDKEHNIYLRKKH